METELQNTKAELQRYKEAYAVSCKQVTDLTKELDSVKFELNKEVTSRDIRIGDLLGQIDVSRQFETSAEQWKKVLERREQQIKELEDKLSNLQEQYDKNIALQKENADGLQLKCMDLQEENADLKNQLSTLNRKYTASYTADELAGSFNNTINSFNSQMNSADQSVNYIINSMDVDLKAQIVKDEKKNVHFVTDVNATGENAMSTLKITIRAIPK